MTCLEAGAIQTVLLPQAGKLSSFGVSYAAAVLLSRWPSPCRLGLCRNGFRSWLRSGSYVQRRLLICFAGLATHVSTNKLAVHSGGRRARRQIQALDIIMRFSLTCPWCMKGISLPSHLGTRTSPQGAPLHRLVLSHKSVAKRVSVCPYCNKPVKDAAGNNPWLLLFIPAFGIIIIVSLFSPKLPVPDLFMTLGIISAVALALVGGAMARLTGGLEKADDV